MSLATETFRRMAKGFTLEEAETVKLAILQLGIRVYHFERDEEKQGKIM